ncbi:MAG: NADH-quinone oxidoreductase subunit NuoK [Cyanobacteria bacterium HKST-UBA06]|nr:NADH-quinone oxidoreductase subunit NuoK [Cyanobacteria bacterium HKST-UBA05]MCA9797908.1 NADH-quinone oxidoreductase subunit NuoK [Cyanobacteria bacterium HKST-UBA04]MCA9807555.1 NADH-quinone oxidoreductase subunit NuoK [Cyanobacteria bacterium HKST-UBA06]MCA9841681.1 NADH-quinone oxidoreductase subunit NuoK [Cyanobacteria bacterium HKST-UBA03]
MLDVGLYHYLILAVALFSIGLYGVLASRNAIRVLMSLELMLNAVNINLVAFNNYLHLHDLSGQVFSIFILTVSAAEASVGLAVLIALFRRTHSADMEQYSILQG